MRWREGCRGSSERRSALERAWNGTTLTGLALAIGVGLASGATAAGAQTVSGRVLDEALEVPVPAAVVRLVDVDGEEHARVAADELGRFSIAPPFEGEFVIAAERLGYEPFRSPLFGMAIEGSVRFDLLMRARPIGLEGFSVAVEAGAERDARLLAFVGHTPETLGARWIDSLTIAGRPASLTPASLIRNQGIPGIWAVVGTSPLTEPLCVVTPRARTMDGRAPCALTVVDGVVVNPVEANQIDPLTIKGIAILRGPDATTFYGGAAAGGAVLIFTR